jgi:hypothetical protein
VWIALSPEGRFYVYRQDYRLGLTSEDQAEARIKPIDRSESELLWHAAELAGDNERGREMRAECREHNEGGLFVRTWTDHSADSRLTYLKHGVHSWPALKEVQAGIDTLNSLLDPGWPGGPRLFFVRNNLVERDDELADDEKNVPTCFEEEVGRIVWKTVKVGGGEEQRDVPVDKHNHAFDAVRYACHSFILRGGWA